MAKVKEVLECEFMGPAGDYGPAGGLSRREGPRAAGDKYMKKSSRAGLKMHAERIKEGEFALQTGVQLAVEFIGANARNSLRRPSRHTQSASISD